MTRDSTIGFTRVTAVLRSNWALQSFSYERWGSVKPDGQWGQFGVVEDRRGPRDQEMMNFD